MNKFNLNHFEEEIQLIQEEEVEQLQVSKNRNAAGELETKPIILRLESFNKLMDEMSQIPGIKVSTEPYWSKTGKRKLTESVFIFPQNAVEPGSLVERLIHIKVENRGHLECDANGLDFTYVRKETAEDFETGEQDIPVYKVQLRKNSKLITPLKEKVNTVRKFRS